MSRLSLNLTVVLSIFSLILSAQEKAPINIIIENDPLVQEFQGEYHLIRADLIEQISLAPQLYNILERENYDELLKERAGTQKLGEDLYESSVLEGASFLLKLTIISYEESWDSVKITKPEPGKLLSLKIDVEYSLQLVDLSTTEVKDLRVLKASGTARNKLSKLAVLQRHELKRAPLHYVKQSMKRLNRTNLLQMSGLRIEILEMSEAGKNMAKQLIIEGGTRASYVRGLILKVVRETTVSVRGKDRTRVETLGDVRIDYCGRELSGCNVLNGGKGIYEALRSGEPVYCLFSEKNEIASQWSTTQKEK